MNYKLKLEPNVSMTVMEGQTVLFSKKTGDFYGLNDSATYLVEKLIESDLETTVGAAATHYKVEPQVLKDDLEEIVTDLEKMRLASRSPL